MKICLKYHIIIFCNKIRQSIKKLLTEMAKMVFSKKKKKTKSILIENFNILIFAPINLNLKPLTIYGDQTRPTETNIFCIMSSKIK